jgi:PhoH-like ATPase
VVQARRAQLLSRYRPRPQRTSAGDHRGGRGRRSAGDPDQIDRSEVDALSNGIVQVVERFRGEPTFAHLTMKDVVRSKIAEMAARLL